MQSNILEINRYAGPRRVHVHINPDLERRIKFFKMTPAPFLHRAMVVRIKSELHSVGINFPKVFSQHFFSRHIQQLFCKCIPVSDSPYSVNREKSIADTFKDGYLLLISFIYNFLSFLTGMDVLEGSKQTDAFSIF